MTTLTDMRRSALEWTAWQNVCKELRKLGVEINDHNELTEALKVWGELLHDLRVTNPLPSDHPLRQEIERMQP